MKNPLKDIDNLVKKLTLNSSYGVFIQDEHLEDLNNRIKALQLEMTSEKITISEEELEKDE